jgi:hypothetical protein
MIAKPTASRLDKEWRTLCAMTGSAAFASIVRDVAGLRLANRLMCPAGAKPRSAGRI